MPDKTFVFDQIKKLMGWCPNARAAEARRNVSFENFNSDIPERAGKENGDLKNPDRLRKTSIQTLLINTFLTLVYIPVINPLGINLTFLLTGSLVSLFFVIFYWKAQMKRYDALAKQPIIDYSNKKKLYYVLSYVFLILIFSLNLKTQETALQAMFSFGGGLLISMWLSYFQLIYWEKKNHKTIYFEKSYGTWRKSYIILEKK
jgi:hypothetical protein